MKKAFSRRADRALAIGVLAGEDVICRRCLTGRVCSRTVQSSEFKVQSWGRRTAVRGQPGFKGQRSAFRLQIKNCVLQDTELKSGIGIELLRHLGSLVWAEVLGLEL